MLGSCLDGSGGDWKPEGLLSVGQCGQLVYCRLVSSVDSRMLLPECGLFNAMN